MTHGKTRFAPRLESLEAKALLSGGLAAHEHVRAAFVSVPVTGSISGTFQATGASLPVKGSGSVSPLGKVKAMGTVNVAGTPPVETASGVLNLKGKKGGLSIQIQSNGPVVLTGPVTLPATVVGSSGRFQGEMAAGTATVTIGNVVGTHGKFSVSFALSPTTA